MLNHVKSYNIPIFDGQFYLLMDRSGMTGNFWSPISRYSLVPRNTHIYHMYIYTYIIYIYTYVYLLVPKLYPILQKPD